MVHGAGTWCRYKVGSASEEGIVQKVEVIFQEIPFKEEIFIQRASKGMELQGKI